MANPTHANRLSALLLAIALALGLIFAGTGCEDIERACRAYCEHAAECLNCGGNVEIRRCKNECLDLTFNQQQDLSQCVRDDNCASMLGCNLIIGFQPPNPCVF